MAILEVRNLSVDYLTDDPSASAGRRDTALRAVEDVSFSLEKGRSLGLVGESGCGKTTAMLGLLRLLPGFYNGRATRAPGVFLRSCERVSIRAEGDTAIEFDGDPHGRLSADVSILPDAVRIYGGLSGGGK